jgi:rubrerythrin
MYPEFAARAREDRDAEAVTEFEGQADEAREHATMFRQAARTFGFLTPIEQHHAQRYGVALEALHGNGRAAEAPEPIPG